MASLSLAGCMENFSSGTYHSKSRMSGTRPNIVLIMVDDMGFSDIGCYGGEINTPHLDNLAANGLRFTQFYNTARCCPTRASLMTGLYSHQAGVGHMVGDYGYPSYQGYLNDNCVTIAEALKPGGYKTYMAGKWHVCPYDRVNCIGEYPEIFPTNRGFNKFYGTISGAGSYFNPSCLMKNDELIEADMPDYHYTDAISHHAANYVTEHRQSDPGKPFFMYVAYTAPHWPLHAPQKYIDRYKGKYAMGWDQLRRQRHKRMIEMGIVNGDWPLTPRDGRVKSWDKAEDKQWQQRRMEVYAAQVDQMDEGIGKILSALEKTGQLDNTLILFLSDNGGCAEELPPGKDSWIAKYGVAQSHTADGKEVRPGNLPSILPGPADTFASYGIPWANASNTPFRWYKKWAHEGGIATPLIVHWPDQVKNHGQLRRQPGHVIDIMATCLDVAGADYPTKYKGNKIKPLQGITLLPAFENKNMPERPLYFEHQGNRAIRLGKWKLVARNNIRWELYDLEKDRTELNDLADKYPGKVEKLKTMYEQWAKISGVLPYPVRKKKK